MEKSFSLSSIVKLLLLFIYFVLTTGTCSDGYQSAMLTSSSAELLALDSGHTFAMRAALRQFTSRLWLPTRLRRHCATVTDDVLHRITEAAGSNINKPNRRSADRSKFKD
jgi:hypothetical protein